MEKFHETITIIYRLQYLNNQAKPHTDILSRSLAQISIFQVKFVSLASID